MNRESTAPASLLVCTKVVMNHKSKLVALVGSTSPLFTNSQYFLKYTTVNTFTTIGTQDKEILNYIKSSTLSGGFGEKDRYLTLGRSPSKLIVTIGTTFCMHKLE